jgi:hypothetical protein
VGSAPALSSRGADSSPLAASQSAVETASLEVPEPAPAELDLLLLAGAAAAGLAVLVAAAVAACLCRRGRRRRELGSAGCSSAGGVPEPLSETCDGLPTTLFTPLAPAGIDASNSFRTNTTLWNFSNDFDHQATIQGF